MDTRELTPAELSQTARLTISPRASFLAQRPCLSPDACVWPARRCSNSVPRAGHGASPTAQGVPMDQHVRPAAHAIARARKLVVFTGAGVSKESGIATFREPETGLWARYDPMEPVSYTHLTLPTNREV